MKKKAEYEKQKTLWAALCLMIALCLCAGGAYAAKVSSKTLPAEMDSAVVEVQEEESTAAEEKADSKPTISVNRAFGGLALASLIFLTYAFATEKKEKKTPPKKKKKR